MPTKPSARIGKRGAASAVSMIVSLCLSVFILPQDAYAASPPRVVKPALLAIVDQPDIRPDDRIVADKVLRALPSLCRNHLKNFYVTYEKNPKNRALGGESTIIIRRHGVPVSEFMALIVHECGHVADLGGLRGSAASKPSAFVDGTTPIFNDDPSVAFYRLSWDSATRRKRSMTDAEFVSGYAKSDSFEDFGETFAFYALQRKEFARLAAGNTVLKAKYDFMANIVFAGSPVIADGNAVRGKRVPWDVTKLPYTWHAKR